MSISAGILRAVVAGAALLFLQTPLVRAQAPATAPHIDYAEVVSAGFGGAGEAATQGPIRRYVTHTPVWTAKVGTTFSMKVRTVGHPDGADVTLRFVWRAPRLASTSSKIGRRFARMNEVEVPTKIGAEVERSFEFKDQAQIVSGTWRAEVWNGRRRLAMRRFGVK